MVTYFKCLTLKIPCKTRGAQGYSHGVTKLDLTEQARRQGTKTPDCKAQCHTSQTQAVVNSRQRRLHERAKHQGVELIVWSFKVSATRLCVRLLNPVFPYSMLLPSLHERWIRRSKVVSKRISSVMDDHFF